MQKEFLLHTKIAGETSAISRLSVLCEVGGPHLKRIPLRGKHFDMMLLGSGHKSAEGGGVGRRCGGSRGKRHTHALAHVFHEMFKVTGRGDDHQKAANAGPRRLKRVEAPPRNIDKMTGRHGNNTASTWNVNCPSNT